MASTPIRIIEVDDDLSVDDADLNMDGIPFMPGNGAATLLSAGTGAIRQYLPPMDA
jgi:hypothetical protein